MTHRDLEYYQRREAQERNHAERSEDMTARRVHQEMAERYSAIVREIATIPPAAQA